MKTIQEKKDELYDLVIKAIRAVAYADMPSKEVKFLLIRSLVMDMNIEIARLNAAEEAETLSERKKLLEDQ